MGRWLAGRLMKELGLVSCQQPAHRYKRGCHEHVAIPDYLERQFAVTEPNQVWCGNVTSIWTGKHWTYLAVVLDLFARKPVGWAMSFSLDSRLTMKALELHDEIADLDVMIATIVDELAPELIKRHAVGYESASQLLITAGDNPQRLRTESDFAALCGVSPVPVSSGKTNRYRLNRSGDRAANSALHIIAIGRLRTDNKTKEYVARRVTEGHTKMEAIRCPISHAKFIHYYDRHVNSIPITS